MQLWNAHLLIGCEPSRDLGFEIFLKLNSASSVAQSGIEQCSRLLGVPFSEQAVVMHGSQAVRTRASARVGVEVMNAL
jgi:hypothetical protein